MKFIYFKILQCSPYLCGTLIPHLLCIQTCGHTGGGLTLGREFPIWVLPKQMLNTRSLTKSKLIGVYDMMPNIVWTCSFLLSQRYGIIENLLLQDNKSSIPLEQSRSPQVASPQGIPTSNTSSSQIGWTWRISALIVVPPRRWLLILWPSPCRAVTSGIWDISSCTEWVALNLKLMRSVLVRRPARSLLRRARLMASTISQWPTASAVPSFWHNSTSTIVPQECVGVLYMAYQKNSTGTGGLK